ncbi:hypothetical protein E2562_029129 [Oryza meyeriana var. granulata]|uniref:Uncharacterized protein n=1 Tax=Oryza meyeriana var. granulata TaxID=110450 RepID=A0A6G1EBS8_9ORYZ|nr:hypothetical protein E2562_029129 [Oryza meyeriana var. granulata]
MARRCLEADQQQVLAAPPRGQRFGGIGDKGGKEVATATSTASSVASCPFSPNGDEHGEGVAALAPSLSMAMSTVRGQPPPSTPDGPLPMADVPL